MDGHPTAPINKKALTERDICTKFITPAISCAGWDVLTQVREEVSFTKGRVIVKGKTTTRGEPKRADYILYYKPNIPIAVIEAADFNLDRKNPHDAGGATDDPELLIAEYEQAVAAAAEIRSKLKAELAAALERA